MTSLFLSRLTTESRRKIEFLFIGGLVTAFSFVQLWLMIDVFGFNYWLAYAIQTIVSVELNFFGNYLIAWRDKKSEVSLHKAHGLFWLARGAMVIVNPFVFALLIKVGVVYLFAQMIIVIANTILNYITTDKFAFSSRWAKRSDTVKGDTHALTCEGVRLIQPYVSVVVPVKGRHETIRELVDSYLKQDYSGKSELILVGDRNDTTWSAIADYIEAGNVRVIEAMIETEDRDANAKRNIGLEHASGDVLVLTDSDVILPPTWISHGVTLMNKGEGYHVVAGSLKSIKDVGFWSSYTDDNPFGSKTPRMTPSYILNRENIGKGRFKQPITASMFIDRKVYEDVGGLDIDFVTPYEDYPYADVIVRAGYTILCDGDLVAYHYHREGFKSLISEYRKAGYGCADYVLRYPFSRLAASRALQLVAVGVLLTLGLVALILFPAITLTVSVSGLSLVSVLVWLKVRYLHSLLFPCITLLLSLIFAVGMIYGLWRRFWRNQDETKIHSIKEMAMINTTNETVKVAR